MRGIIKHEVGVFMYFIRRSRHNIFVRLVALAVLFFTHSAGAVVVFSDFLAPRDLF